MTVTVKEMKPEQRRVKLDCVVTSQDRQQVVTGTAEVIAPDEKVSRPRVELPEVHLHAKQIKKPFR